MLPAGLSDLVRVLGLILPRIFLPPHAVMRMIEPVVLVLLVFVLCVIFPKIFFPLR